MMKPPSIPTHFKPFTGLMTPTSLCAQSLGQAVMVSDYIGEAGGFFKLDSFEG